MKGAETLMDIQLFRTSKDVIKSNANGKLYENSTWLLCVIRHFRDELLANGIWAI